MKQKEAELNTQKDKYEKIIAELKKQAMNDKAYLEAELKKRIQQLEEELKEASKGFEA